MRDRTHNKETGRRWQDLYSLLYGRSPGVLETATQMCRNSTYVSEMISNGQFLSCCMVSELFKVQARSGRLLLQFPPVLCRGLRFCRHPSHLHNALVSADIYRPNPYRRRGHCPSVVTRSTPKSCKTPETFIPFTCTAKAVQRLVRKLPSSSGKNSDDIDTPLGVKEMSLGSSNLATRIASEKAYCRAWVGVKQILAPQFRGYGKAVEQRQAQARNTLKQVTLKVMTSASRSRCRLSMEIP